MVARNFATALEHIFAVEGGYVDHPKDPGGATNMGITLATLSSWRKKPVTKQEVKNLSREEAAEIYRTNYWNRVQADALPAGVDLVVFDHAVHSGPARAIRNLQGTIHVQMDGLYGPVTQRALEKHKAADVVRILCERRMMTLKRLPTWSTFGKGWTRRLDAVQHAALALCSAEPEPSVLQEKKDPPSENKNAKSFLASRTIWGAGIAIIAQLLLIAGYPLAPDMQAMLVDTGVQIAGIAGAAVAIWGRCVASDTIKK